MLTQAGQYTYEDARQYAVKNKISLTFAECLFDFANSESKADRLLRKVRKKFDFEINLSNIDKVIDFLELEES